MPACIDSLIQLGAVPVGTALPPSEQKACTRATSTPQQIEQHNTLARQN